jgi:hypothetical protein
MQSGRTSEVARRRGGVIARWLAAAIAVLAIALHAAPAYADSVTTLIDQLKSDDSDKVRLSAAINLAKLGDPRAILTMVTALGNDSSASVRSACAVGLSKLVTGATDASRKRLAIDALKKAASSDDSDSVQGQAQKALTAIGVAVAPSNPTTPSNPSSGGSGGIYVNIGPMSSKAGTNDAKFQALMAKTAQQTMAKVASSMMTTWPGSPPSKAALTAKGVAGFFVDGTLNEVKIKESGSSSTISCKVNMLIASFPDKSMFGFLNGGASVQASASPRDEAMATEDCISAVVEDLITKKIVPTIKSKASP